ncbi:G-type lectin S-receptor-like serine/threonine-protein kinase At4g27290 [Apium graveolens]|uniref:G-type lectin S-receptor-like serine/threonine-protein kinase At4g27290 n=1 Tax=Apium graveolens TaxID=4045 RepID=UPI003D7A3639
MEEVNVTTYIDLEMTSQNFELLSTCCNMLSLSLHIYSDNFNPRSGSSDAVLDPSCGVVTIECMQNNTGGGFESPPLMESLKWDFSALQASPKIDILDENHSEQDKFVWQSFDYPVDNLLPCMKFGVDLVSSMSRNMTPWTSDDNPSPGNFKDRLDPNGTGPSGLPSLNPNGVYTSKYVINHKEIYYTANLVNTSKSTITRLMLLPSGYLQRLLWNRHKEEWTINLKLQETGQQQIGLMGCTRDVQLKCGDEDGFFKYSGVKLPVTRWSWYNTSMNLAECEMECLKNWLMRPNDSNNLDLPSFDFIHIANASNNFSNNNKIGESGFGIIYKVWRSFNEGNLADIVDGMILESSNEHKVFRVIQIGLLLCMQEYPEDRPNMSLVYLMLTSNNALPRPKQPGFFSERRNSGWAFPRPA